MTFKRRKLTHFDTHRTSHLVAVPEYIEASKESVKFISNVLGKDFCDCVINGIFPEALVKQALASADLAVSLLDDEYEEDLEIDLQATMAVVLLKVLFPFNPRKQQSRLIDLRRFLRDYTGWPEDFKLYLAELLITDRHLDKRGSVYSFNYPA